MIRKGMLKFGDNEAKETSDTLYYLKNFVDISKEIGGSRSLFYCCIGWIYKNKLCDTKRLLKVIHQYSSRIPPVARKEETLQAISDVYNLNLRTGRVYLREALDRHKFEEKVNIDHRRK